MFEAGRQEPLGGMQGCFMCVRIKGADMLYVFVNEGRERGGGGSAHVEDVEADAALAVDVGVVAVQQGLKVLQRVQIYASKHEYS